MKSQTWLSSWLSGVTSKWVIGHFSCF
jgi:hypothetical protein